MLRLGPERTDVNMAGIISFPTTVIILSTDWEDIWPQIADVDSIQNRHFSEADFRTIMNTDLFSYFHYLLNIQATVNTRCFVEHNL